MVRLEDELAGEDCLFMIDEELGIVYSTGQIEYFSDSHKEWLPTEWTRELVFSYHRGVPELVEFISTI